jgi:hypothetical protein
MRIFNAALLLSSAASASVSEIADLVSTSLESNLKSIGTT